ncbi:MAG: hypothetical protein KGI08_05845, partial [Thaumarchaeota archaeon]|nr:hypothetical protein [Nitrososphaerota archaeon]
MPGRIEGDEMRALILSLMMSLVCGRAWATISYVSYSETAPTNYNGTAISTQTTQALSTTTGNLIVVTINGGWGNCNVSSVSDTASNTYHQATGACVSSAGVYEDIWYAYNITGNTSNVVTVHYTNANGYTMVDQIQFSGASTSSDPFETAKNGTASGTSATTASFSPAA